jgi:WD40 repeat protein
MSRPSFQRLEELFQRAVDLPSAERAAFLDRECAGEPELRKAVENLLRHDRDETTIEGRLASPVAREASALRHAAPTLLAGAGASRAAGPFPVPEVPGYESLEELGRGGMGVVYKARQKGLNRTVALKMLLPFAAPTPEQLARFRTEAEALAKLSHPNVVPIYEVGECPAGPYFSMEYVPGPSLAAYLGGHPCDPPSAARLVELLARAIDAVHDRGIVHRDLKPGNVLLAPRREPADVSSARLGARQSLAGFDPKITDFGLAKDRSARRALTLIGTTLGTPCYMAPEQASGRGEGVGPAADLYSLGAILYEMLTGRPPFDGDTPAETVARVTGEEPLSPSRLRPGLPRDLITICLKCLEKSPRRRYASARDLAEDLRRFQRHEPIRARLTGPLGRAYRWCRRRPLVAGLLALCAALVVAFAVTVWDYDARLKEALARAEGKSEQERQEIVRLNVAIGITEMENGDTFSAVLYFSEALHQDENFPERQRSHRTRIAAALRQSPRLSRLFVPGKHLLCARLADTAGRVAAVGADNSVEVWDVQTGRPVGPPLRPGAPVKRACFGPEGRALVTVAPGGAARVWEPGDGRSWPLGEEKDPGIGALASADGGAEERVSDDGRRTLTLAGGAVRVSETRTGAPVGPLLKPPGGAVHAAISPHGHRVAVVDADNTVRVAEAETGRWLGGPFRPPFGVSRIAFSPDGKTLLTAGRGRHAQVWKAEGELVAALAPAGGEIAYARFGPDGRLLVTGDADRGSRVWDAATGRPVTPPLRHGGPLVGAAFSADGRHLVTAGKGGAVCVWELPPAPEGTAARRADGAAAERSLTLAGAAVRARQDPAGAAVSPPRTADGVAGNAVLSPDGGRVVACGADGGVRIWDAKTGEPLTPPLPHGGAVRYAAFSGDGSRLVTAEDGNVARAWDAATGEALAPALRVPGTIAAVYLQPDGDRAVVEGPGGAAWAWDLTPDRRPLGELTALANVLACGSIDDANRRQVYDADALRAAWQKLQGPR